MSCHNIITHRSVNKIFVFAMKEFQYSGGIIWVYAYNATQFGDPNSFQCHPTPLSHMYMSPYSIAAFSRAL